MTTYITIALLSASVSAIATFYIPNIISRYNTYLTRKNKRLSDMVREEVERQLKNIIND
jgi:hypothetical protein